MLYDYDVLDVVRERDGVLILMRPVRKLISYKQTNEKVSTYILKNLFFFAPLFFLLFNIIIIVLNTFY